MTDNPLGYPNGIRHFVLVEAALECIRQTLSRSDLLRFRNLTKQMSNVFHAPETAVRSGLQKLS